MAGSNSGTRSTLANRSAVCLATWTHVQSDLGLTKTDQEWSEALEEALTVSCRGDLKHGSNAAYVAGCVCKDCREHQRQRMAKTGCS
jgi:hypothetical protein